MDTYGADSNYYVQHNKLNFFHDEFAAMELLEFERQRATIMSKQQEKKQTDLHNIPIVQRFVDFCVLKFGSLGGLFRSLDTFALNQR